MEGDLAPADVPPRQVLQHRGGEVQPGGGGGYRTFGLGEDGLVAVVVGGLGGAVEVGGQGDRAGRGQDLAETDGGGAGGGPGEGDDEGVVLPLAAAYRQGHRLLVYGQRLLEVAAFPPSIASYQHLPLHPREGFAKSRFNRGPRRIMCRRGVGRVRCRSGCSEVLGVVHGRYGVEAKDLDRPLLRTGRKVEPGVDDARPVAHQQGVGRETIGQGGEGLFADGTLAIDELLGGAAVGQGVTRDALLRQVVGEGVDGQVAGGRGHAGRGLGGQRYRRNPDTSPPLRPNNRPVRSGNNGRNASPDTNP